MKTINLTAELSNIAMETLYNPISPTETISKFQNYLNEQFQIMGDYVGTSMNQERNLDEALTLNEYQLDYENYSIQMEFIHFKPRGTWQVKQFRFIN
jgi:hypothetical protein